MWIVLEATIDTRYQNTKSWMLTAPQIIDLPWKLDNGWISLSLEITYHSTFSLVMLLKMSHTLYPLYNPIRDKFHSLFENVLLGSLKSFLQLNHQVDISLYLTEAMALCHSRHLVGLTPSQSTLSPCSLLAPQTLVSIPFHYTWKSQDQTLKGFSIKGAWPKSFNQLPKLDSNTKQSIELLIFIFLF
jgi:hypothetical protein